MDNQTHKLISERAAVTSRLTCYSTSSLAEQLDELTGVLNQLILAIDGLPELRERIWQLTDLSGNDSDDPGSDIVDGFLKLVDEDRDAARTALTLSLPAIVNLHGIELLKWELRTRDKAMEN